jgi:hypothetical protein
MFRAYSDQLVAQGPKIIDVPEIVDPKTGGPLRVYVWPITGLQKRAIVAFYNEGDRVGMSVQTLIQRACDEHGNRLFVAEDIEALQNQILTMCLGDLIERIAIKIGSLWANVTVEDARGN